MYKEIQNKKYYLAINKFPKAAKKLSIAYHTGYRTWTTDDMITYSIVLGTYRIMFGIKKENLCSPL